MSAPFTLAAEKSDGGCDTLPWHCSLPGYRISTYFWEEVSFLSFARTGEFGYKQATTDANIRSYLLVH